MLFNSIAFVIFLPIVFALYWLWSGRKSRLTAQNLFLIAASYLFYGWWDYRFLSLIFVSSLVDYLIGLRLDSESRLKVRKLLLTASLTVNLGLLGFFKYYGFFVDSFVEALGTLGYHPSVTTLNIILPVGISFYTFQTLSYTLDIYRGKLKATRDAAAFFAFVSFFPQLVAGPIERARNLLPQFKSVRVFDVVKAKDGLRQMLWGMLKKVVVADNLAPHVESIFANYSDMDSLTLFIGAFFFTIQIYCDFSGYSDIAIGTSRLFGFSLMQNFAFPFFSRDIAEFWQRWHISLSTWFRDYVYIPLGGSHVAPWRQATNIMITFTISGLWHGANWTFIVWGFLNGLYFLPLIFNKGRGHKRGPVAKDRFLPSPLEAVRILTTFSMFMLGLLIFRSESITHAWGYLAGLFRGPLIDLGIWHGQYLTALIFSLLLLTIEWFQRDKQHALAIPEMGTVPRWTAYVVITLAILFLGNFGELDFIYFQF